jgi:ATP/maltotriose-dependent transcriptional regulator MalT
MLFKAHRAVGELETAMGHLDEAAHHLNQALTMATACAMPYERMLSLLALAELRSATGEIEDARALLADARSIGESLGATLALARADALETRIGTTERAEPPARLSPREIDVLQRIAAGRSNKEIAYEFAMSLRTVERHSANLYAKLGVASRAEAIAFAHQHGLIER